MSREVCICVCVFFVCVSVCLPVWLAGYVCFSVSVGMLAYSCSFQHIFATFAANKSNLTVVSKEQADTNPKLNVIEDKLIKVCKSVLLLYKTLAKNPG